MLQDASLQEGTSKSNGINFDVPNLDPEACFHGSVSMGTVGSSSTGATIIEDTSVGIAGGFGTVIGDAVVSNVPVQTPKIALYHPMLQAQPLLQHAILQAQAP
jgi:hypothetical protein